MSKLIQPITALRDTAKLEKDIKDNGGYVYITKNGYAHLVVLSPEYFESLIGLPESKKQPRNSPSFPDISWRQTEQSDPYGFVRVRAATIPIKVGNVTENAKSIIQSVRQAATDGVKILVLPELCLCGYTCGDLLLGQTLLDSVSMSIRDIAEATKDLDIFFALGAPLQQGNRLYNCAIAFHKGQILGVVPKSHIPNYGEFYEARYFSEAKETESSIMINGEFYPFGTRIIFIDRCYTNLKIAIELCEDLWVMEPPSIKAVKAGAAIILNCSASNEVVGKAEYRRTLIKAHTGRLNCGYVYANVGIGESTTDVIYAGNNIIAEAGTILEEAAPFSGANVTSEIDLERLYSERLKQSTFANEESGFRMIPFAMPLFLPTKLIRQYGMNPFIPSGDGIDLNRVKEIMNLQAMGLAQRLEAINVKKILVGLSGGLDSTLALLVGVEAFKKMGWPLSSIKAITLPAFGTSKTTHDNAVKLASALGVTFDEIILKDSLLQHFKDIKHDPDNHNVAYENAQARERTQILMDIANDEGSLMVGTGDLSELCLGWTTYNGDHMSMYGVNASLPKTLVRYLCEGYAFMHDEVAEPLRAIISTPISPELLPPDAKGQILQKTEESVGPYEVVDFFIYHYLRFQYRPKKLFYLVSNAYEGVYSRENLKKWMRIFFKRFFQSQFKRSCLPDGVKVGSVAISPRGDWRMPSDASCEDYLREIDALS